MGQYRIRVSLPENVELSLVALFAVIYYYKRNLGRSLAPMVLVNDTLGWQHNVNVSSSRLFTAGTKVH